LNTRAGRPAFTDATASGRAAASCPGAIHREWHITITRRDEDHWSDISKDGPVGNIVFRPGTVTMQYAEIGGDVAPGADFVHGRRPGGFTVAQHAAKVRIIAGHDTYTTRQAA